MFTVLTLAFGGCQPATPTDRPRPVNDEATAPIAEPDDDTTAPKGPPMAQCTGSVAVVSPPFETGFFDASGSYDPFGSVIVSWEFTLVAVPDGSKASLIGTDAKREITPDLAGEYVAEVVVGTADGRQSAATTCGILAEPAQALWVEMFWVTAPDDMDLHLVAPGGEYKTYTDCYYANLTPDWGAVGPDDDPALDLDDIPGTGPENININPSVEGDYTVLVHDYTGSNGAGQDFMGDNDVTVKIYIDGLLEFDETRTITGDGADEYYATVTFPGGAVAPM